MESPAAQQQQQQQQHNLSRTVTICQYAGHGKVQQVSHGLAVAAAAALMHKAALLLSSRRPAGSGQFASKCRTAVERMQHAGEGRG